MVFSLMIIEQLSSFYRPSEFFLEFVLFFCNIGNIRFSNFVVVSSRSHLMLPDGWIGDSFVSVLNLVIIGKMIQHPLL